MNDIQPVNLEDVASYWRRRNLVREDPFSYSVRGLQRFLAGQETICVWHPKMRWELLVATEGADRALRGKFGIFGFSSVCC